MSRTCRKCGALLPISSKSTRTRTKKKKSEKKAKEKPHSERIEISIESVDKEEEKIDLHEIPKEIELNLDDIPSEASEILESDSFHEVLDESEQEIGEENSQALQEITPKPFQSSLLSGKKDFQPTSSTSIDPISDAFSKLKQSILEEEKEKPKPSLAPIHTKT